MAEVFLPPPSQFLQPLDRRLEVADVQFDALSLAMSWQLVAHSRRRVSACGCPKLV